MSILGSISTAKLPTEFTVIILLSFKEKLRPPSYCCSVLLDPRIYTIILPGKLKYVLRIKCFKVTFKKVYTGATKIWT